jgi:leucyl aminopeptidase
LALALAQQLGGVGVKTPNSSGFSQAHRLHPLHVEQMEWFVNLDAIVLAEAGQTANKLHLLREDDAAKWRADLPGGQRAWLDAHDFKAKPGTFLTLPCDDAGVDGVLVISEAARLGTWDLATAASKLPGGTYRLQASSGTLPDVSNALIGWLLCHYKYSRYVKSDETAPRRLITIADIGTAVALAEASALVRDLVNTPTCDMGPTQLAQAAQTVADRYAATTRVIVGDDLLHENYPTIHMVGRAAADAPRLIDIRWGQEAHPKLTIVGKGVCFDSGGLNIKPSSGMLWMKKDMGGAAHALALAELVMRFKLPVRLRLLIPAVENAISGNAFRPGDIVHTRMGLSVEIGNTDAEGRLVLCDALATAADEQPDLLIDFATLTGAARVALGPDVPALFCNDDALADSLATASRSVDDPLWRLPLWQPYAEMLKSPIADLNNSAEGGFAGAITAALFLKPFVAASKSWAHVDVYAWNGSAKAGRPKGGEAMTLRAFWAVIRNRYAVTS